MVMRGVAQERERVRAGLAAVGKRENAEVKHVHGEHCVLLRAAAFVVWRLYFQVRVFGLGETFAVALFHVWKRHQTYDLYFVPSKRVLNNAIGEYAARQFQPY